MDKRIVIIGVTGCGKTTFAKLLSKKLQIPMIELDTLFWGPEWAPTPLETFQTTLKDRLKEEAWIADGNYRRARNIIWGNAQMIIWLDYPFCLIFGRLLKRSLGRILFKKALWNNNQETFQRLFSRESILLWMIKTYSLYKREIPRSLRQPEYHHLKIIRLCSLKETREFLRKLSGPYDSALK